MAVVIGLMMVGSGLAGVCLLFVFVRELASKLARVPYLERAEGTVTAVHTKVAHFRRRPMIMHFPVITFAVQGETQTFTSEVGDGNNTRYFVGQKIGVRYYPIGDIPPTIDSWSGLWLAPVMGIVAGVVLLGGAALVYVAFGERIFGG